MDFHKKIQKIKKNHKKTQKYKKNDDREQSPSWFPFSTPTLRVCLSRVVSCGECSVSTWSPSRRRSTLSRT